MTDLPKVSIVIPVYNGGDYLGSAIESALAQTYKNIEVIVINDGSDDEGITHEIARSYGDKIRYYKKTNGGVASALNLGIAKMEGEYMSWLSHDDMYVKDKVSIQVNYILENSLTNSVLYSDYMVEEVETNKRFNVDIPRIPPEKFRFELVRTSFVHGCTTLVPRICFERIGLFNEELPTTQDYELWIRMARYYDFVYVPGHLVIARSHQNQGSRLMSHISDIDEFYEWAINQLPADKIRGLYGVSETKYFLGLASNYKSRGLDSARREAVKLARRSGVASGMQVYWSELMGSIRKLLVNAKSALRVALKSALTK